MPGVLSFTLGIEASNFLRTMGLASGQIMGLGAAMEGAKKAFELVEKGLGGAIERGADLEHLSKRTGETVSNLYKLQKGFAAAGVSMESVGPMLYQMQKALGGVSEMGEDTGTLFDKLGLSIKQLKDMGGAGAMEAIFKSLAKLEPNSATKAAASIFGRFGGGDALQIARSGEEFSDAMRRAAPAAYVFEQTAKMFERIELSVRRIKAIWEPFWLGIAKYAGGPILEVLKKLEGISLKNIGEEIGKWLGFMADAFKNGSFGEALSLSLEVGFEKATFYAQKLALSLGAAIMAVVPSALAQAFELSKMMGRGLQNLIGSVSTSALESLIKRREEHKASGLNEFRTAWSEKDEAGLDQLKAQLAEHKKIEANWRAQRDQANLESIRQVAASFPAMFRQMQETFLKSWQTIGPAPLTESERRVRELANRFAEKYNLTLGGGEKTKPGEQIEFGKEPRAGKDKSDASAWEKLGLVFNGSGSPGNDYARSTAQNTREMIPLLKGIRTTLVRLNPDFGNQV